MLNERFYTHIKQHVNCLELLLISLKKIDSFFFQLKILTIKVI